MRTITKQDIIDAARAGNHALAAHLLQQWQQQNLTKPAPTVPPFPTRVPPRTRLPGTRRGIVSTPKDLQTSAAASEKPVKVCYGHCRVGADIIWVGFYGGLWVFHLRWCWGEIDSITKIQLASEDLPASAVITNYLGTTGQTADATLALAVGGGYSDTLVATIGGVQRGIAYSVVTIPYHDMPGSLDFTCELQGLEVEDTRVSLTQYSTNPALHLRDFLKDSIYGCSWSVDDTSFETLADDCDELVGGDKRYESNLVIDQPQPTKGVVETLLTACNAFLICEGTSWKVRENRTLASMETFDLRTESVDRSERIRIIDRANQPNTVRVRYQDTSVEPWAEATAEATTSAVDAGTEFPRVQTVQASFVHTHEIANRMAIELLNGEQLPEFEVEWLHRDDGIRLQRGDVITLSKIPGFSTDEDVRILQNNMKRSNQGYLRHIVARQYQAGAYSDDVTAGDTVPQVTIMSPFSVSAVTDVAMDERLFTDQGGYHHTVLEVTWTGVSHPHVRTYRVLVTDAGSNVVLEEVVQHQGDGDTHDISTPPVELDILYTASIWAISTVGAPSAVDTDTHTPTGSALPPGDVTDIEATEYWGRIDLNWTNVLDENDLGYRIKRGVSGDTYGTAAEMDVTIAVDQALSTVAWSDHDVPSGEKIYFIKAIAKNTLESSTADSVTINIQTAKGSWKDQNPMVPYWPMSQTLYTDSGSLYSNWFQFARCGAFKHLGMTGTGYYETLSVTGPGVITFLGFAVSTASGSGHKWGARIIVDGNILFALNDEAAPAVGDELAFLQIGDLSLDSGGAVCGYDNDYVPFNTSLSVEVSRDSTDVNVIGRCGYFETKPEYPANRPSIPDSITLHQVVEDTYWNPYSYFQGNLNYHCMNSTDTAADNTWTAMVNWTTQAGILRFAMACCDNTSGSDQTYDLRITLDGDVVCTLSDTVSNGSEAAIFGCGNVAVDSSGNITDVSYDDMPFEDSCLVEIRTTDDSGANCRGCIAIHKTL